MNARYMSSGDNERTNGDNGRGGGPWAVLVLVVVVVAVLYFVLT